MPNVKSSQASREAMLDAWEKKLRELSECSSVQDLSERLGKPADDYDVQRLSQLISKPSDFVDYASGFVRTMTDRSYQEFMGESNPNCDGLELLDRMTPFAEIYGYKDFSEAQTILEMAEFSGAVEFYGKSGSATLKSMAEWNVDEMTAAYLIGDVSPDVNMATAAYDRNKARLEQAELPSGNDFEFDAAYDILTDEGRVMPHRQCWMNRYPEIAESRGHEPGVALRFDDFRPLQFSDVFYDEASRGMDNWLHSSPVASPRELSDAREACSSKAASLVRDAQQIVEQGELAFANAYIKHFDDYEDAAEFFRQCSDKDNMALIAQYAADYRDIPAVTFSTDYPNHALLEKADECFGISAAYGYESTTDVRMILDSADLLQLPERFDAQNTLNAIIDDYDVAQLSEQNGKLLSAMQEFDSHVTQGNEVVETDMQVSELHYVVSEYTRSPQYDVYALRTKEAVVSDVDLPYTHPDDWSGPAPVRPNVAAAAPSRQDSGCAFDLRGLEMDTPSDEAQSNRSVEF